MDNFVIKDSLLDVKSITAGYTYYSNVPVISDISFSLNSGDILGVCGRNGSGKSTITSAIFGICQLYQGRISLSGEQLDHRPLYYRAQKGIRLLPQNWQVFPALTVLENLAIPIHDPYTASDYRRLIQQIDDVLEKMPSNLQTFWINNISSRFLNVAGELSGGERQILALMRALLGYVKVLLLDEPLQHLSSDLHGSVCYTLKAFCSKPERAIVLVEHDLNFIKQTCNKFLLIDDGKILLEGDQSSIHKLSEHYNNLTNLT